MDLREFITTTPLPTRKEEFWKYVDLKFLDQTAFQIVKGPAKNQVQYDVDQKKLLLTVRSTQSSALWDGLSELPQGIELPKSKVAAEHSCSHENYFSKLNRSDTNQVDILVKNNFDPEILVHILFDNSSNLAQESLLNSRINLTLEPGAEAFVIERTKIQKNYFFNSCIDYFLLGNSKLKLLKVESGDEKGWCCHTAHYFLKKDAQLFSTTATIGSNWSRHNVFVALEESGAEAQMLATYLAEKEQFVDHHTAIEHMAPQTTSLQKYTGVLADKAKAVFNGQVKIDRYAQKSSAEQINRNLLLSRTAEINTKPELQIDADDVKAKHGATVGQIQPEELFYLLSRGISEKKARAMLIRGFIEEIGLLQPAVFKKTFFKDVGGFLDKVSEE